jgi:hypothetical protein
MIEIRLNNGVVLYPENAAKGTVTFINPAFDKDRGERSFSNGFYLPDTPDNNNGLAFLSRIDTEIPKEAELNGRLIIEGVTLLYGHLKIGENDDKGVDVDFVSSGRYILDHLDEIKVSDAVDDIYMTTASDDALFFAPRMTSNGDGTYSYNGTVIGVELIIAGESHEYVWRLGIDGDNTWSSEDITEFLANLINADYVNGASSWPLGSFGIFLLAIHTDFLLPDAVNPINMELLGTSYGIYVGDVLHERIVSWIVDAVENDHDKVCFPLVRNVNYYEGKNLDFGGWINDHIVGDPPSLNSDSPEQGKWRYTYVPMYKVRYVLNRIIAKTFITQMGDEGWNIPDFDDLIIYNEASLDFEWQNNLTHTWLNILNPIIRSSVHLPAISCKEFLLAWLNTFNLHYIIKGDTMLIRKNVSQLEGETIDWTDRTEDRYKQHKKTPQPVSLHLNVDKDEGFKVADQLLDYSTGDDPRVITLPAASVYMGLEREYDGIIPVVSLVPISLRVKTSTPGVLPETTQMSDRPNATDPTASGQLLKYIWYRGLALNSKNEYYAFATHGRTDLYNNVVGDLSLAPNGVGGLYDEFWKGWLELDAEDIVTVNMLLTIQDIKGLIKWENPKRKVITDKGQVSMIIKEIVVSFSQRGLGLTKVTGVRIK